MHASEWLHVWQEVQSEVINTKKKDTSGLVMQSDGRNEAGPKGWGSTDMIRGLYPLGLLSTRGNARAFALLDVCHGANRRAMAAAVNIFSPQDPKSPSAMA